MRSLKHFMILCLSIIISKVNAQKTFASLDELLNYANTKNISMQQGNIKISQAKKAKLAAQVGIIDPTVNNSFSVTNNLKQLVNLFPGEVFGGQPGSYKEVTTGTKYANVFNNTVDIKLLNLGGWANVNLAKTNIASTMSDNKLTKKTLYENIASSWFNIINLQEQIKQNRLNLSVAETLYKTAEQKYNAGLVKQQDVNDAKASMLDTKENTAQLVFMGKNYENSLKILCDIPDSIAISIEPALAIKEKLDNLGIDFNDLTYKNSLLKEQYALDNYRQIKQSQLPTISFFLSDAYQQNSSGFDVFNGNSKWYHSNYIGLKLNFPMPSAKSLSQKNNARYDYQLAQKNTEHTRIKSQLDFNELTINYDKAVSQAASNKEIFELRKDTYQKNQQLYVEGIISIDQTLNSYNAMVDANYRLINSQINVQLATAKIDINNKMK